MRRFQQYEEKRYRASVESGLKEMEAAARTRSESMAQEWHNLRQGWEELEKKMAELGITSLSTLDECMAWLNVGGSPMNVHPSALKQLEFSPLIDVLGCRWDHRLPLDSDGLIVLDESPACFKQVIHQLMRTSEGSPAKEGIALPADEVPYLAYVSRALGLRGMGVISGGSKIVEAEDVGALNTLQDWCDFTPGDMVLICQASRDGWLLNSFHSKCRDDSPLTVSLFKVNGDNGVSIIGGFSSVSWTPEGVASSHRKSPGAFLFMLRDGSSGKSRTTQPVRWGIRPGEADGAVKVGDEARHQFGKADAGDISVIHFEDTSKHTLRTRNSTYDISAGCSFLDLNGKEVTEIEVFRVSPGAVNGKPPTASVDDSINPPNAASSLHAHDIRVFGTKIAGSLLEERFALHQARDELTRARARVESCSRALAAVYGPDVAAGKEDEVVDLSVRGARVTTLRSTLLACADSALAARFAKGSAWSGTEDVHTISDCSASVFAKVLDVLRMRKRASWAASGALQQEAASTGEVRVAVNAADRGPFETFVNMYFPGRERFVMDCVDILEA